MSEPCLTGVSLTDMTMCPVLNAASKETLPQSVRPEATLVEDTELPTNLIQAINDCDGTSTCKYIGFDFFTETSELASDVQYVVDTYDTSQSNAGVLVKKEETSPGDDTYTKAALPLTLVSSPGYDVLPMTSIGGTPITTISVNNQEDCARACDNTTCAGFNFSARSGTITASCELYSDVSDTLGTSDKTGFIKESIPSQTITTTSPVNLENQGGFCKDPLACNQDITRMINDSWNVQKFSTSDLDSCTLCPNRSFNRNGFTVTNEFGNSVRTLSASAAINLMKFLNFDIPGCTSEFRLMNSVNTLECVAMCPTNTPYATPISGTLHYMCVSACPSDKPYYGPDKKCVKTCNSPFFSNNYECVTSCPVDKPYINGGVCATSCDNVRPYTLGNTCIASCPSNYYINGTMCVSSCPPTKFQYRNECVDSCPDMRPPYPNTKTCVSCPSNTPYTNGTTCVASCPNLYADDVCVTSCPSTHPFLNINNCVQNCPNEKVVDNGVCISACPATRPIISKQGICVQTCPSGQLAEMILNRLQCRDGDTCQAPNDINNNGVCISACPAPQFTFTNNGIKTCTYTCPRDLPYRVVGDQRGCVSYCWRDVPDARFVSISGECTSSCLPGFLALNSYDRCVSQCDAGQVALNGVCNLCPAGKTSVAGGVCTNCPAGQSSVAGGLCTPCPAGQTSVAGGLCVNCPAKTSSVAGGSCTACPDYTDSVAGGLCLPCGANTSYSMYSKRCLPCPAGQSSVAGGLCTPCPAGTSSVSGGSCVTCPANTSSTSGGGCVNCPAGQTSVAGGICTNCRAGTQSNGNRSGCTNCGAYWGSPAGGTCSNYCPSSTASGGSWNQYLLDTSQGSYSVYYSGFRCIPTCLMHNFGYSYSCVADCPPGYYEGPDKVCQSCPAGYYTPIKLGKRVCETCPAGTYSNKWSETCSPCPGGTFSTGGAGGCIQCPPGTIFPGSNGTSPDVCQECSTIRYSVLPGQTVC